MTTMVPSVEVLITDEEFIPPVGSAGVAIVFGNFERASEGRKYHIKTAKQAKNILGNGYSGNNYVDKLFTKFEDTNSKNLRYISKGVTKIIALQIGTRTGATATLKDDETTSADTLKFTMAGGVFGNDKTIEVVDGKISGQIVNIYDENSTLLKSYLDVQDKAELIRRINKDTNPLIVKVEDLDPDVTTLANTTTTVKFVGGLEDNNVTNQALIDALEIFEESKADFVGCSEKLTMNGYEMICEWSDSKVTHNSPLLPVLQVPDDFDYAQLKQLGVDTQTMNRWLINGKYNGTSGAETSALIIALAAGMNVSDSPDYPTIAPINYVEPLYSKIEKEELTDAGITVFDIRSEEDNQYGLNLAVTGEQRIKDTGQKCHYMHVYVVRALHYCIKYLDLTQWLKKVDYKMETIDAELAKRIKELKDGKVIKEGEAYGAIDEEDPNTLNIIFKVQVGAILLDVKLFIDVSFYYQ